MWAPILFGDKIIECRTWKINFWGDFLITSEAYKKIDSEQLPVSCACKVVKLVDIVPFRKEHLKRADLEYMRKNFCVDVRRYQACQAFQGIWQAKFFEINEPIEFLKDTSEKAIEEAFAPFIYR